jgi:hypothetical protein
MHRLFSLREDWAFILFAFLDIVCVGLGMGVPFFCILFGLLVGWYIARKTVITSFIDKQMLRKILLNSTLTSSFTFVLMALLWGTSIPMLFDPTANLANFGIPQILYQPKASFVGWMVLMIIISPFLQLLMSLFGAYLTALWLLSKK